MQSQLRKKGETFNKKIENAFMEGLNGKSLSARIRKWTIRRDQLRNMAQHPHATSGGPAVSLDNAGTRLKADQHGVKQEEEMKADLHVVKEEEEQKKGVKRNRMVGGGTQCKKKRKQQRIHCYRTLRGACGRLRGVRAAVRRAGGRCASRHAGGGSGARGWPRGARAVAGRACGRRGGAHGPRNGLPGQRWETWARARAAERNGSH